MTDKKTILVTGANGQLGNEMRVVSAAYPDYNFFFVTRQHLPIDDLSAVTDYFDTHPIDYCVNCAAYTAVDKAEAEPEKALLINAAAVGDLAALCKSTTPHLSIFLPTMFLMALLLRLIKKIIRWHL